MTGLKGKNRGPILAEPTGPNDDGACPTRLLSASLYTCSILYKWCILSDNIGLTLVPEGVLSKQLLLTLACVVHTTGMGAASRCLYLLS